MMTMMMISRPKHKLLPGLRLTLSFRQPNELYLRTIPFYKVQFARGSGKTSSVYIQRCSLAENMCTNTHIIYIA